MNDVTDRIDRNARAALAVLGADTQRSFQRADESIEAFVSRMAYNIAYAMEAERKERIERGQVVDLVEEPPHDDNWPRLPSVLSGEQTEAICLERFPGFAEIEDAVNRKSCYDNAWYWHKAMFKALSEPETTEPAKPTSQGMAFPVRVFGLQPGDWIWPADLGSTESLQRITSAYQLGEIGFFVRDAEGVEWTPDGDGGYKLRDGG